MGVYKRQRAHSICCKPFCLYLLCEVKMSHSHPPHTFYPSLHISPKAQSPPPYATHLSVPGSIAFSIRRESSSADVRKSRFILSRGFTFASFLTLVHHWSIKLLKAIACLGKKYYLCIEMSRKGMISRTSDKCLISQEQRFLYCYGGQAVMRKFTLAYIASSCLGQAINT